MVPANRQAVLVASLPMVLVAGLSMAIGFGAGRLTTGTGSSTTAEPLPPISQLPSEPRDSAGSVTERVIETSTLAAVPPQESPTDDLRHAIAITDPGTRQRELENALSKAGLDGVKKALLWVNGLPEGPAKRAALAVILKKWGELDGPAAAAYAETILAGSGSPQLLVASLRGWGQANPDASIQYTQGLAISDGVCRDITREILGDWADRDPVAAANYATATPIDVGRGGATPLVAQRWSRQDPEAAARWALDLPEGRDKYRALDALVRNWSDLDIKSAAGFVTSRPAGPDREVLVSTLAREVSKSDPVAGLQWASTLSDPLMQERTTLGVLWHTARQDAAAARQLVETSSLSTEVKAAVVSRLENANAGRALR